MYKILIKKINEYQNIYITRHSMPDNDALGSQLGLKEIILTNFQNKNVFAIGDMHKTSFLGEMDNNEIIQNSLLIITDTCVKELLPLDIDLSKFKEIIVIDHHKNECNIDKAIYIANKNAAAACQIIANFSKIEGLKITNKAFICLYAGIISDTNRFNYSLSKELFNDVGYLISLNYDYKEIYDKMYADTLAFVKMKAYFTMKFIVDEVGLAYLINDESEILKFNTDFFSVSRGMVNVMANISGIKIWANFTQNPENHKIACEFRSNKIPVLDVALKYNGGGHLLACGASVDSWEIVHNIINELKSLAKEE